MIKFIFLSTMKNAEKSVVAHLSVLYQDNISVHIQTMCPHIVIHVGIWNHETDVLTTVPKLRFLHFYLSLEYILPLFFTR